MPEQSKLISRDQAALVLIDWQEKLLPVIWDHERVLENAVRLAKFARIIGLPVIVTEQQKLGPTVAGLMEHLPGTEPITKITFDCFGCKEFSERMAALGRDTLILTGVEAHICVGQTGLSALGDYNVQVVSDACSSRVQHNWLIALERLRAAGAVITSTEMAIYELLRQAGTDEFKATLPLVK